MRGKPTVDGEADTAQLRAGMFTLGGTPVTSPALAGESVTTSAPVPGAGGPRHGNGCRPGPPGRSARSGWTPTTLPTSR